MLIVALLIYPYVRQSITVSEPPRPPASAEPRKPAITIPKGKFDALYHAMKAIEGATTVGVNYLKFSELLQTAATEVLVANDNAKSDGERTIIVAFADALGAYSDSATVWKKKNESAGETGPWMPNILVGIVHDGAPSDPFGLVAICEKYGIEVSTGTVGTMTYRVVPAQSAQLIWVKASGLLSAAVAAYQAAQPAS